MSELIFTIGHSTHSLDRFIMLLRKYGITALCDVRSTPYSRVNPQFNRNTLKEALRPYGIAYVFLGKELGARTEDHSCYVRGKVQYELLARTEVFQKGIKRILDGMKRYRLALMCSEKDPIECHRAILVARQLSTLEVSVKHILEDSSLETHEHALGRLLRQLNFPDHDMFRSHEKVIEDAYRIQGERIAYEVNNIPAPRAKTDRNAAT